MLEIHITPEDYLELIAKLDDRFDWEAGDLTHQIIFNRMTSESRQEYIMASMQRQLNEMGKEG